MGFDGGLLALALTGEPLFVLLGHTHEVIGAAITCDESIVVTASEDRSCRVWDLASHTCLHVYYMDTRIRSVAISSIGLLAICLPILNEIRFVRLGSGNSDKDKTLSVKLPLTLHFLHAESKARGHACFFYVHGFPTQMLKGMMM